MSYRILPRTEDLRQIFADVPKSTLRVDNGVTLLVTIPCTYLFGIPMARLGQMHIDHMGWPSPDNPDDSYQPYEEESIDLEEEGYDSVVVVFDDAPNGLSAIGVIDEDMVRLTFDISCGAAESDDLDVSFAVFITGTLEDVGNVRHLLMKGVMHIVAGPMIGE